MERAQIMEYSNNKDYGNAGPVEDEVFQVCLRMHFFLYKYYCLNPHFIFQKKPPHPYQLPHTQNINYPDYLEH